MAQAHPTTGVAATKLPKERLDQLDRLARASGISRSRLMRNAIEAMLDESEEGLSPEAVQAINQRRLDAEATYRIGAIRKGLTGSSAERFSNARFRL